MNFKKSNEKCVLALLSGDDMSLLGLTYDELDYRNEKTRLALKDILSRAKSETDFSFRSKLRIDVMPGEADGCLILFTDMGEREEGQIATEAAVFECDDFSAAADCASALLFLGLAPQSSFYMDESSFRLIIEEADKRTLLLAGEYMKSLKNEAFAAERTKETMKCLIEKDALKILGGKRAKN